MAYVVLARRLRPRTFSDVVGHRAVISSLEASINENRFHHAFLLTGTRGVGKTTLARIIAKSLNCKDGPTSTPCGQCDSCKRIDAGEHEDVIEVDAASRTKVEDTRELIDTIAYSPVSSRYKIYIIDEVHMLSNHSFNAILKTVEEPPEHVRFIFATTDPKKLPITLVSRCLRLHLKPLPDKDIFGYIKNILEADNIRFEEKAINYIAEQSKGSMRDALSIVESMLSLARKDGLTYGVVQDYFGVPDDKLIDDIISSVVHKDKEKLIGCWEIISSQGLDYFNLLKAMQKRIFSIALDIEKNSEFGFDVGGVHVIYHAISKAYSEFSSSPDVKISFQMLTLRLIYLQDLIVDSNSNDSIDLPNIKVEDKRTDKSINDSNLEIVSKANKPSINYKKDVIDNVTIKNDAADVVEPNIHAAKAIDSSTSQNWKALIKEMRLSGLAKILAQNCVIHIWEPPKIVLHLNEEQSPLLSERQVLKLKDSLGKYLGQDNINLEINISNGEKLQSTPAWQDNEQKKEMKIQVESKFCNEEGVKKILSRGGTLDKFEIKDDQDITI